VWCEGEAIQKLKTSIVMAASSHLTDSHSTVSLPTSETAPSENSCTDTNQSQSECAHPKSTDVDLGPDVTSHNTLLTFADQLWHSSELLSHWPISPTQTSSHLYKSHHAHTTFSLYLHSDILKPQLCSSSAIIIPHVSCNSPTLTHSYSPLKV